MVNTLRINPNDSVVVALDDLPAGTTIEWADADGDDQITAQDPIPFGHKVAIQEIQEGETVIKYGASIGVATQQIAPGQHVHTHNLTSVRGAASS